MALKIPRLIRRSGIYYWRCLTAQRQQVTRSLYTHDPQLARQLALELNLHAQVNPPMSKPKILELVEAVTRPYKVDLVRGVYEADGPDDHKRLMEALHAAAKTPKTAPAPTPAPAAKKPLKRTQKWFAATQTYAREREADNAPKTLLEKKAVFAEFAALAGDTWLNSYDKTTLVRWKAHDETRGLTARRRNKRLGFLSDFFRWAIAHGLHDGPNPCEGLRISTAAKLRAKAQSYQPFSDEEIALIFGQGYTAFMNQPNYFWLPWLGLYTGARIEELAKLKTQDVQAVDGVPCLYVFKGKNAHATRHIPIHSALMTMGFWDYAQKMRQEEHTQLFPELKDSKNGFSKNASRRFGDWLDKLGITSPQKVFHSFRHTVITRLHATGANHAHVMQLTGHADELRGVHFSTYTHRISPKDLAPTLERLRYDSLPPTPPGQN